MQRTGGPRVDLAPQFRRAARTFEALKAAGLNARSLRKGVRDIADETSMSAASPRFLPRSTQIALESYERELISEGELAGMLRLGRIETRELLDEMHALFDAVDQVQDLDRFAAGQAARHADA